MRLKALLFMLLTFSLTMFSQTSNQQANNNTAAPATELVTFPYSAKFFSNFAFKVDFPEVQPIVVDVLDKSGRVVFSTGFKYAKNAVYKVDLRPLAEGKYTFVVKHESGKVIFSEQIEKDSKE